MPVKLKRKSGPRLDSFQRTRTLPDLRVPLLLLPPHLPQSRILAATETGHLPVSLRQNGAFRWPRVTSLPCSALVLPKPWSLEPKALQARGKEAVPSPWDQEPNSGSAGRFEMGTYISSLGLVLMLPWPQKDNNKIASCWQVWNGETASRDGEGEAW